MANSADTQDEVLGDLLRATDAAGIGIWFCGGHGIDALEGTRIREHDDIDLCCRLQDQPRLREALTQAGFAITESGAHYTKFTTKGQGIDTFTFETWPDGRLVTDTGETGAFPWPENTFPAEPNGVLLGRPVRAMSYEGIYVFKAGFSCYDPSQPLRDKDRADLELITSRIPPARLAELGPLYGPIPGTRQRFPNQDR